MAGPTTRPRGHTAEERHGSPRRPRHTRRIPAPVARTRGSRPPTIRNGQPPIVRGGMSLTPGRATDTYPREIAAARRREARSTPRQGNITSAVGRGAACRQGGRGRTARTVGGDVGDTRLLARGTNKVLAADQRPDCETDDAAGEDGRGAGTILRARIAIQVTCHPVPADTARRYKANPPIVMYRRQDQDRPRAAAATPGTSSRRARRQHTRREEARSNTARQPMRAGPGLSIRPLQRSARGGSRPYPSARNGGSRGSGDAHAHDDTTIAREPRRQRRRALGAGAPAGRGCVVAADPIRSLEAVAIAAAAPPTGHDDTMIDALRPRKPLTPV